MQCWLSIVKSLSSPSGTSPFQTSAGIGPLGLLATRARICRGYFALLRAGSQCVSRLLDSRLGFRTVFSKMPSLSYADGARTTNLTTHRAELRDRVDERSRAAR